MATLATSYDISLLEPAVHAAGVSYGTTINPSDIRLALRAHGIESGEAINDSDIRLLLRAYVGTLPNIEPHEVNPVADNILNGVTTIESTTKKFGGTLPERMDPDAGNTDMDPIDVGGSVIPQGAELIRVKNPEGSDEPFLYFLSYDWRGVKLTYEVGGPDRFRELFGSTDNFAAFRTISQAAFDDAGFVQAGSVDPLIGSEESIGSRIEREVRAQGLEDLPGWLGNAPDALALVAEATAQEWSSGRLWKELSQTDAFQGRFGDALPNYLQGGVTIQQAVNRLVADEDALRNAIRPFLVGQDAATTDYLHGLLNEGWTPGFVAQVLEQAEVLRRDPESLAVSNFILEQSGLEKLDEVGFLNALNGYGPQETVEALNTATAARAMEEAGIDLDDDDIALVMELVDTSDRLLTADSWRNLTQELSLNLIRFNRELDEEKLGAEREDLIAAAFGKESPTGKAAGEVLSLVARFERDRRAAAGGFDQTSGFQDAEGRLRIQGMSGL